MNFTKFDAILLITMTLAIVAMSFMVPALGLASAEDAEADEDDLPEFEIESDRFDMVGDFPDRPGTPSTGMLVWDNQDPTIEHEIWIEDNLPDGIQLAVFDDETGTENYSVEVQLNDYVESQVDESDTVTLDDVGDRDTLQDFGYNIQVEYKHVDKVDENDWVAEVEYSILQQSDVEDSWYDRIPVIGAVFGAGETLAGIVGWIGAILYWTLGTLFEIILNLMGILYDTMIFFVDLISWMITTYSSIVSNANSWAGLFVAIPGLLLFVVFAKIVFIGIKLLPQT